MILGRETQELSRVVDILSRAEETLEKLHHYYKFGRHLGASLDELYFWFAHCAHLVFSLRQAEENGLSEVVTGNPHFASLVAELDFTPFHYLDYRRRTFYWNAYRDYLKAEPRWFRLWVRILEESEGTSVSDLEEFSRLVLTGIGHEGPTDRRMTGKNEALTKLLQTSLGGHIFASSMRVLTDMVSTLASCVAGADPASHGLARIRSLACLLSRMRNVIVWDGAAQGPYSLRRGRTWGVPSAFASLWFWRAPGMLRITPKDEGGEITCTYTWTRGSKTQQRSWTRSVAAQGQEYEDSLFDTWSYDGGEWVHSTSDQAATKACWVIAGPEATYLETICQHADAILANLAADPTYGPIVEEAARMLRAGENTWGPRSLVWTHVKDLDLLVGRLKRLCGQAQGIDGTNNTSLHGAGDQEACDLSVADLTWGQPGTEPAQEASGEPLAEKEPQGEEPMKSCPQADQTESDHQEPQETLEPETASVTSPVSLGDGLRTLEVTQEPKGDSCHDVGGKTESHDEGSPDTPVSAAPEPDSGEQPVEQDVAHDEGADSQPQEPVVSEEPESGTPDGQSEGVASALEQAVEEQDSCCVEGEESHDHEDTSAGPEPEHPTEPAEAQALEKPESIESHADSAHPVESIAEPTTTGQFQDQADRTEVTPEPVACEPCSPPEPVSPESSSPPEPSGAADTPHSDEQVVPPPREKSARAKKHAAPDADSREVALLVQRLAKHHRESKGGAGRKPPLSLKRLQQELRWGQAKVQSVMTAVFGEKPFIQYAEKCKDGTIFAFLGVSTAVGEPPKPQRATGKSSGSEAATKSTDKRTRSRREAPVRTRRSGKGQGPRSRSSR